MATRTQAELRDDVLRALTVLAAGQVASADDAAIVDAAVVDMLDWLDSEGVITWDKDSDIPRRAYRPIVRSVAAALVADFGKQSEVAAYEAMAAQALVLLRRLAEPRYMPSPVAVDYF